MYNRNDALVNNIAIQAINNNKIYIYTVSDINGQKVNDGWLKVGQTIRTTDTRVREQSHTAGLTAEILYEVSAQRAVIAKTDADSSVVIVGFDEYNTYIMDPSTGEVKPYGMNDSTALFQQAGHVFISYLDNQK